MTVISLKDYAKNNGISYEAVRQQVVHYADELGDHIIKDGRQQFLDEKAVAFLDSKRQKNPVAVYQIEKDEEIERLTDENKTLLVKIAAQADQIAELAQWKAENALLIAESKHNQALISIAEERARVSVQERIAAEEVSEQMRKEAKMRADEAELAKEARRRAEQQAADLQTELDAERQRALDLEAIANARWWERPKLKKQFAEKWKED